MATAPEVNAVATPELDLLIRRAGWIGQGDGPEPVVSFTSLFLAFFASDDDFSTWVAEKAGWVGPRLEDVVRCWNLGASLPTGLNLERVRKAKQLGSQELAQSFSTTPSAANVLNAARSFAQSMDSSAALGTRHVFAVYLYQPPTEHDDDLKAWKLDAEAWGARFVCYATEAFPKEAEAWRGLRDTAMRRNWSTGVMESLRWASLLAQSASKLQIDARLLLEGILHDGMAFVGANVTSYRLAQSLGERIDVEDVLRTSRPSAEQRPSTPMPFAPEVEPILDRARLFAVATPGGDGRGQLHVRHLVAAILTDRRPLSAFELLRRARRTSEGVLAQLRGWLVASDGPKDDLDVWDNVLAELREDTLAGYDNDEAHGEDRLRDQA
ncbi:MAG: hypothetical protein QM756_42265 [Polyangiaceae bacterium]